MNRPSIPSRTARLAATLLLALTAPVAQASAGECPDTAQAYWASFRAAALGGDRAALAGMSRFPFALNGMLDESPKRKLGRKQFIAAYPRLLETDPGLAAEPSTMRALLAATPRLASGFCNPAGNRFRVGAWVFALTPQGWRFVQAFVDE